MLSALLFSYPRFRAMEGSIPMSGGLLYTYAAGTMTPKATYADAGMGAALPNPIVLDSDGEEAIFLDGTYKMVLKDATGATHWTMDNVYGMAGLSGSYVFSGPVTAAGTVDVITADYEPSVSLADLTICSFVATGANQSTTPTFNPDGLGAKTIVKKGGVALVPGDIPGEHAVCIVEYNSAHARWELLNPTFPGALGAANLKMFMNAAATAPEWASGAKVISTSRNMATGSGDVAYTGFGFKPSSIIVIWGVSPNIIGIGLDDASNRSSVFSSMDSGALAWGLSASRSFYVYNATAKGQQAYVKTFDSDGLTLTWVNDAGPSGSLTIFILAYR